MTEETTLTCRERLESYLREAGVPFEVLRHRQAYTMPEVAAALHVSGHQVAKVVIVEADGKIAMLVLPSPERLRLPQVRQLLGAKNIQLARESEFAVLFPDCATGAMPPFGHLYDIPVYVDHALAEQDEIVFRVGTHRHTMRMAYADYARLAKPVVADLTGQEEQAHRPAA
jgi:Ala-tRNA(Pro) deacylase